MESLPQKLASFIEEQFDKNALPALQDFIRIPNLSKMFDQEWATNGLLDKAANFLADWIKKQDIKGAKIEVLKEPNLTPLLFVEIDGSAPNDPTILMYGHFDKQPPMTGWSEGLGPTNPVIIDDKLYGRGSVDDGYAIFAYILAIKALQVNNLPHARVCILLEGDEESGSSHLKDYLEKLEGRIGTPSMIIISDAGCLNYEQLWITTTLRGHVKAKLTVKIITEGVHSGDASGVVPDTFRIIRMLLSRIEDTKTGKIISDFEDHIPGYRYEEAQQVSKYIGNGIFEKFPWIDPKNQQSIHSDPFEQYLNRIWRPQLVVVGQDGLPSTDKAGNVLRPETSVQLALRIPPTMNADKAFERLKEILEKDPPYGAEVKVGRGYNNFGWNATEYKDYLDKSLKEASEIYFGKPLMKYGEGGSIPFVNRLSDKYPKAQIIVTGVCGPNANAHGPNEMLNLPYTKKFISCFAYVLATTYEKLRQE